MSCEEGRPLRSGLRVAPPHDSKRQDGAGGFAFIFVPPHLYIFQLVNTQMLVSGVELSDSSLPCIARACPDRCLLQPRRPPHPAPPAPLATLNLFSVVKSLCLGLPLSHPYSFLCSLNFTYFVRSCGYFSFSDLGHLA